MHATIIGGGRIGRGFVSSLLTKNDVTFNFIDLSEELIQHFNEGSQYMVHILGNKQKDTIIKAFKGFNLTDNIAWQKELEQTDFIFTAVGGKNLVSLGRVLGEQYSNALKAGNTPKFILVTCENWMTPADDLRTTILETLTLSEQSVFIENVDVTQGVIRASGTSAPEGEETINPLDTWMQDYWSLPIDAKRIEKNGIPEWVYFEFKEDFGEMLAQKIYTNNTSVALIAYLGYLKGYEKVSDAANDPEIETILKQCYEEINYGLIHSLGVSEESQLEFSKVAEDKYKDPKIIDYVTRIARDPIRKLAPDDRMIGPAKMAISEGLSPEAIATGTAAALFYDHPEDEVAQELKRIRKKDGLHAVLKQICGLEKQDPLTQLILKKVKDLKNQGWISEEDVKE